MPSGSVAAGACPPGARHTAPELVVPQTLRTAALQGHWAGWQQAPQTLDAEVPPAWLDLARRGQPLRITLCGERSSLSFDLHPQHRRHTTKNFRLFTFSLD